MNDTQTRIREEIVKELAAMADEYRDLRGAEERLREVDQVWWSLIRAYESVTPDMTGDARQRSETIEAAVARYRNHG